MLIAAEDLVLDWSTLEFYNTLMALTTGATLASIARVMRDVAVLDKPNPRGWAINFGVLGTLGTATGLHMTLAWPLAPQYAYDNISFGEPMAVLGVMTLGLAFFFWTRADEVMASEAADRMQLIAEDLRSLRYLIWGIGAGLIGICVAVIDNGLFVAPVEEPVVGLSSAWDATWLTTVPLALLFAAVGVVALLVPNVLDRVADGEGYRARDLRIILALKVLGITFIVIAAFVYFSHIGMVVNTSSDIVD